MASLRMPAWFLIETSDQPAEHKDRPRPAVGQAVTKSAATLGPPREGISTSGLNGPPSRCSEATTSPDHELGDRLVVGLQPITGQRLVTRPVKTTARGMDRAKSAYPVA